MPDENTNAIVSTGDEQNQPKPFKGGFGGEETPVEPPSPNAGGWGAVVQPEAEDNGDILEG